MRSFETEGSKLVKYTGSSGVAEIPNGIKTIGTGCFKDCVDLEKVNIPDTVEIIEAHAFENCTNLREINLPYGLTSIGEYAFFGCVSLEGTVRLCYLVETVGAYAFGNCAKLRKVIINCPIDIGEGVFQGCVSLTGFTANEKVTYSSHSAFQGCTGLPLHSGGFIVKRGTVLSGYFGSNKVVIIPDGIREIAPDCFQNRAEMEQLYIPDTVVRIGANAFRNCVNLRTIRFPDSACSIGQDAFFGCKSVGSDCVLPDRLLSALENSTFRGCPGLERSLRAVQTKNTSAYERYLYANHTESVRYSVTSLAWGSCSYMIRKTRNGIYCNFGKGAFSIPAEEYEEILKTIFETVQVANWRSHYWDHRDWCDGSEWELEIVRIGASGIHCRGYIQSAPNQDVLEKCLSDLVKRHTKKRYR